MVHGTGWGFAVRSQPARWTQKRVRRDIRLSALRHAVAALIVGALGIAFGQTAFLSLARDGSLVDVLSAVRSGVDVNYSDQYGQSALMYAARANQDPNVIIVLVAAGADVNATTSAGWTALMYAARYNPNPKIVSTLLDRGADPTAKDGPGHDALYYAKKNGALVGSAVYSQLLAASMKAAAPPQRAPVPTACCKYCRKGKACGDSCISRSYTCHKGPGCACNASISTPDNQLAQGQQFFIQVRDAAWKVLTPQCTSFTATLMGW